MAETHIPQHIGFILDGNRRWARARGLVEVEGHKQGYQTLKKIAEAAHDRGVKYLTAYVFSTENWNRSTEEVEFLMNFVKWVLNNEVAELHSKGIRLLWVGSKLGMKPQVIKALEKSEALTQNNTEGTLALCLNHGGHREIAEAVQRIVQAGVPAGNVDEQLITQYIDSPELPPIDLIIRTSGEQRLSNFMLWRAAYSELIFRKEPWPDFTVDALDECLLEYSNRQRRFGG